MLLPSLDHETARKLFLDLIERRISLDEVAAVNDSIARHLRKHPLVCQFEALLLIDKGNGSSPPWMAVGSKLATIMLVTGDKNRTEMPKSAPGLKDPYVSKRGLNPYKVLLPDDVGVSSSFSDNPLYDDTDKWDTERQDRLNSEVYTDEAWRLSFAMILDSATTYMWQPEILDVVKASPMPSHVIGKDPLAFPVSYFFYPAANSLTSATDDREFLGAQSWELLIEHPAPEIERVEGVGQRKSNPGISIYTDAVGPKKMQILSMFVPYGKKYPEEIDPVGRSTVEGCLQKHAFLRSPYARKEHHHVPRQIRKEVSRSLHSGSKFDPVVRVITLRRPSGPPTGVTGPRSIEWRSQWWVMGHYRKQWCPSTKTHRVTWIAPYIKGPEDKPIKEKVYDVVR